MTPNDEWAAEPCFVISVAARIVGLHAQTLRQYERAGLIEPLRSQGRQRLYSMEDLARLRRIKTLTDDMGINLAGAGVVLRLSDRIRELEAEIDALTQGTAGRHRSHYATGIHSQIPSNGGNERHGNEC